MSENAEDAPIPVTVVPAGKRVRVESSASLTPDVVQRNISEFRSIDLRAASLDAVRHAVAKLLRGYAITTVQLRAEKIYRARKRIGSTPFIHYRDLWYVPADKAHFVQIGRLNGANEVVFYCTDSQHVALVEVRPQVGDRICILECALRPDARMQVMPLGIHRHLEAHRPELAKQPYEDKEHNEQFVVAENRRALKLLQDFLVEELVRIVPDDAKYLYKTTVALVQLLLSPQIKLHGLAYPSVATDLQGMNFMLTCAAADELLVPTNAWELHLFEEIGPHTFNARKFDARNGVESDGALSWPELT